MRQLIFRLSAIAGLMYLPAFASAQNCQSANFQRQFESKINPESGGRSTSCPPSTTIACKVTVCFTSETTFRITLSGVDKMAEVTLPRNNGLYQGDLSQIMQQIVNELDSGVRAFETQ